MEIEEAVNEFESGNKLCEFLGVHRTNLTQWRKRGYMPLHHQHAVQEFTKGRLIAGMEGRDDLHTNRT